MRCRRWIIFVVFLLGIPACTSSKSTTAPTPTIDLTGTWVGTLAVSGTTARMTWTLTQTNNTVTGPVLVTLPTGVVLLNGTLAGMLTGSSLAYTIAIGSGGIPSRPSCSGQLGGTMTATIGATSTLSGTYSVTSATCTPPFATSGNISLSR